MNSTTAQTGAILLALISLLATSPAISEPLPDGQEYGEGITLEKVTSFKKATKNPAKYAGKTILTKAPVQSVCQNKGCWMILGDTSNPVRVRFKDYGFFVPKDSMNHEAYVQGVLSEIEIPEDVARHYAEDAGEDPSSIKGPQKGLQFMATGVRLVGYASSANSSQTRPASRPQSRPSR